MDVFFWNKYKPLDHRFYSIHNCEIKLSREILSQYNSSVLYDSVKLYEAISDIQLIEKTRFLSLIPKNAMYLSGCIEGENLSDFELQKILAVLNCHNPSHSLALLFLEYLKSPFLKKDLVIAGTFSLNQVQSAISKHIKSNNLEQEIIDLYIARGLNTSYIRNPRFSFRKGINASEGMYLGGWGESLKNMGFKN